MTYGMLADMLGFKKAGAFSQILDYISVYCKQNELPPLTVLVVTASSGLPGTGLTNVDLNADREAVFNFDWFGLYPPTVEEFKESHSA